ncbi:uncharacterized protein LTR77_005241 [Saxophila tyrrhenica]|uniref:DUF6590 domain-containing protein n=1 Tax=Saxophila tyrrhenica TaxID=1690608 RepID=A0AAV9PBG5_9PEZI|nr:hypothetical protein LTR77_005241 [Saxophila tyrrhenica]
MAGWTWDPDSNQYFVYDAENDTLRFQNGRVVARPQHIPRSRFTEATARAAATPSASNYSGPSAAASGNYVATPSNAALDAQTPRAATRGPGQNNAPSSRQSGETSGSVDSVNRDMGAMGVRDQEGPPQVYRPMPIIPEVSTRNGQRIVDVHDPSTLVRTVFANAPANQITDPTLLRENPQAHAQRRLYGTGGEADTERLFADYHRREQPRKFFTIGKVFLVLWVEPAGESTTLVTMAEPGTSRGAFGERVFSKVRRFVVVREADNYCTCLPIVTNRGLGVAKRGVTKSEYSIIHTSAEVPPIKTAERPLQGEMGMRPRAIRVDADDPTDKLHDMSRLDYGKVHTIQHNIKVKKFGKVHPKSMNALVHQFSNVWNSKRVLAPMGPPTEQPESSNAAAERERANAGGAGNTTGGGPAGNASTATQEAVTALMRRGKTREEAVEIVRQRIGGSTKSQSKGDQEDSDDSDEDVPAGKRSDQQRNAGSANGDRQSRREGPQQTGRQGQDRSLQPSQSQQRTDQNSRAQASARIQASAGAHQSTSRTAPSAQSTSSQSTSQRANQGQSQRPPGNTAQPASVRTSSPNTDQASEQAHRLAQARAMMAHLLQQGYTQEDAAEIVGRRFGGRGP